MRYFSLRGICMHVAVIAQGYDRRAEKAEHDFRTKQVSAIAHLPGLKGFPYPVQLMILGEMNKAEDADENDDEPRHGIEDDVSCSCLFYRRYQLPCRHILQHHIIYGHLGDDQWEKWRFMWDESGFEIYETAGVTYVNKELYNEIGAPARRRLEVREVVDSLMQRYYTLEEDLASWPDDVRDEMIRSWTKQVEGAVGPVRRQGAQDFLCSLSAGRQRAVHDSQQAYNQRADTQARLPRIEPLVEAWDEADSLDGVDSEAGDQ
jgi:hypothetical protein